MADKEKERLRQNLEKVIPLFKKEEAVIHLNGKKTLIAADIHGDADALDFILKFAEKTEIEACIFLGDYVDKGPYSIRVLNTLFELKCKHPKKTILLRGNHETKEVNIHYEFRTALKSDPELHEAANDVFKYMPIAVVLNKNIFCVHGGISGKEDEILGDISKEKPMYYLWNDPGNGIGLMPSLRGGDLHRFGADVAEKFLKRNNLKCIIRGHSALETGVRFWFDRTVISLYSTLPYSLPDMKAAVAVVNGNEIEFHFYKKRKKDGFMWEERTEMMKIPEADDRKK